MLYKPSYQPSSHIERKIPSRLLYIRKKIICRDRYLANKLTKKRFEKNHNELHEHNKMLLNVIVQKIGQETGRYPTQEGKKYVRINRR